MNHQLNARRAGYRLFGCLIGIFIFVQGTLAQQDQRLLLSGVTPGLGIGLYNGIGLSGGIDLRYQHPLVNHLTITVKTGLEAFRIKSRYTEYYRQNYQTVTGLSVPITVGPRYYVHKGMYGGLNLGADISVSKLAATSFRFEPAVGAVVPLPSGRYVDVGTSVVTSFSRGSGVYLFTVAYGLGWAVVR